MRIRAVKDLNRFSQNDFLQVVSEGLELTLRNADNLINDAHLLLKNDCKTNSVWILRGIAEEEAAKFLILIDAVRCHRKHERFSKHLQNFNDHRAKGIYAKYYDWRPATFGEIINSIEFYRAEYYLDGPQGIEWVFRNKINQEREEIMYVDYIEDDDGHRWQEPDSYRMKGGKMYSSELERGALRVSRALKAAGCTTPEALTFMSEFWKDIKLEESFHWQELRKMNRSFFEKMRDKGLVRDAPEFLIDHWLFPLYLLDLGLRRVDKNELREIQKQWNPGWI